MLQALGLLGNWVMLMSDGRVCTSEDRLYA